MKRLSVFLLIILLVSFTAAAMRVDTVVVADGGPGPYLLGTNFVLPQSINAAYKDSSRGQLPPYVYVDNVNGIIFSEAIEKGAAIAVSFNTSFYGLPKTYSMYSTRDSLHSDTAASSGHDTGSRSFSEMISREELDVSGFKSIGVSAGNLGQMNLEQALEVKITGNIAPETFLSANLSDQGASIEGETREIGEIDMLYITLENPRYRASAGDQYVSLPENGLLKGRKKIKGLSAGVKGQRLYGSAFGAVSGGRYVVETIKGRQGFQGPYYLSGSGEQDLITPVHGTVIVTVDGKKLIENEDGDYTVNYDLGALRFTPGFPVSDFHLIRVEYEYKSFDYRRMFAGAETGFKSKDSALTVSGAVWYETDNKNSPLEIEISSEMRDSLSECGDSTPLFSTSREVHPNDVASQSRLYPLYRSVIDSLSGNSYWQYTPYNPSLPYENKGFYLVWFTEKGFGMGDYTADSVDWRGTRYRYAGPGLGTHTSLSPAPAPKRNVSGEILINAKVLPWLRFSTCAAGQEKDANLFSDIDDDDNASSAVRSLLVAGNKSYDHRCLWAEASHSYISRRFTEEVIPAWDLKTKWGMENGLPQEMSAKNVWECLTGATVFKGVSAELIYRQYLAGASMLTQGMAGTGRVAAGEHLVFGYSGDLINHRLYQDLPYNNRNRVSVNLDLVKAAVLVYMDSERKWGRADTVRGHIGGGTEITVNPAGLSENVYMSFQRMGFNSLAGSPDTGTYFSWSQKLSKTPLKFWNLSATSSYQYRTTGADTLSTTIVTALSEETFSRAGISARQKYTVTSERATEFVKVPVFAGEGQGAYSLDTSTNEMSPDPFGSYYVYEQEVMDRGNDSRVRKTLLEGDWSLKPPAGRAAGILADIAWRGSFGLGEQVESGRSLKASSLVPGYYSFSSNHSGSVQYSSIFYRQEIEWRRSDSGRDLKAGIHARPAYSLLRGMEEREWEWGPFINRRTGRWDFETSARMLYVKRTGVTGVSGGRDTIADQNIDGLQKFEILPVLHIFTRETGGRASRDRNISEWGYYAIGRPGIRFQPRERGFAEASYAVSWVDVPGAMDWRMALGHSSGLSHTISVFSDIRAGQHFSIGGSWRAEFNRPRSSGSFNKAVHVVSVEVKAFL